MVEWLGNSPSKSPTKNGCIATYRTTRSCQACHMPAMPGPLAISSVAGPSRQRLARHDFVGGNFFMQELFGRFGAELFAQAPPASFQLGRSAHTRASEP